MERDLEGVFVGVPLPTWGAASPLNHLLSCVGEIIGVRGMSVSESKYDQYDSFQEKGLVSFLLRKLHHVVVTLPCGNAWGVFE